MGCRAKEWVSKQDATTNGLQMMLKLVSLRVEKQADMTIHVRECCSQRGGRDYVESQTEGNGANRKGRHEENIKTYTTLSSFILIGTLLRDL
jgi:hypothetical protein